MTIQNANLYSRFRNHFPHDRQLPLLTTTTGESYSYADAERQSARFAMLLREHGLQPGDRLTVQVRKSVDMLWLYLGCLRAGLVFHPLNPAYAASEVAYFLADAEPGLIVCEPQALEVMRELAAIHAPAAAVATLDGIGGGSLLEAAVTVGMHSDTEITFADCHRAPDDLAALLYSSGTTGRPKGIMLSHQNLSTNARTLVTAWDFSSADVLLHALPIFHVHGLFVAIGCVLMAGASMRWLSHFDTAEVMAELPGATVMMGVPTYYMRLLAHPDLDPAACRHIRLFISGSAPLLAETFAAFEQRTGHRILERYGMTETGMNTSNPVHGERRPGTVGLPLPGVEVRVVDDQGLALPAGEIGHMQVRGANVFQGYWRMPEKTAEDFTFDNFFATGDQGVIAEDGYVTLIGRAKDMVISGGLNVYAKEVERVIDTLPGVTESAVIGVPHADFGEAVVAVVVRDKAAEPVSASQVIDIAREQLAKYKTPKRVEFVDELPRNAMGKVQKNILRERYRNLFA